MAPACENGDNVGAELEAVVTSLASLKANILPIDDVGKL